MNEVNEQDILQFVGLKELDPMEQETVQKISTENFEKIKRMLKNITQIKVNIKTYEQEGKRKKYSIHIQAAAPTSTLNVGKSQDYDLARAIHKGFEDLKQLIEHRIHIQGKSNIEPRRIMK